MNMTQRIGERIAQFRKESKLTQASLGKQTGLTPRQISEVEEGSGNLDIGYIALIAEVLGVSLEKLVKGEVKERKIFHLEVTDMITKMYFGGYRHLNYFAIVAIWLYLIRVSRMGKLGYCAPRI